MLPLLLLLLLLLLLPLLRLLPLAPSTLAGVPRGEARGGEAIGEAAPRLGTDGSRAAAAATAAASSTHLAFILARSVAGSRGGATKRVAAALSRAG